MAYGIITYGIIPLGMLFYFSIIALGINNVLTTMLPQGYYTTDSQTLNIAEDQKC